MMPRLLKLMPDYQCNPLWEYEESPGGLYTNPDPAELPLSEATIRDLRAWAAWFDTFINLDDPYDSREVLPEESAAFDQAGRRLWAMLCRELGPGWVVSYFHDGKLLRPPAAEPGVAADGQPE
jgi:hypothetical protein